jgi:hypothetical protein
VPIITLFIGGSTAGRLANLRDRADAFIHGALVCGLALLLATYLLGTGASRILGGTLNLVGNLTGSAVSAGGAWLALLALGLSLAAGAFGALRNAPRAARA